MDTEELIDRLNGLMRLDVDTVHAYEEAIERIDAQATVTRLQTYREDHLRHIDEIRLLIMGLGGQPNETKPSLKGRLLEVMTVMRSALGDQQTLKAVKQTEEITDRTYRDAAEWDVADDIHEVLARSYDDERRHLTYVREQVEAYAETSHSR